MKNILLYIAIHLCLNCALACSAFAQMPDSLRQVLDTLKNDSLQMQIYKDLCWKNRYKYPVEAMEYGQKALQKAQKLKNYAAEASLYNYIGVIKRYFGDYAQAMLYYEKALELAQQYHFQKEQAYAYNNISNIYNNRSLYEKALEYALKAYSIFEQLNDQDGIAYCCNQLALAYADKKDFQKALDFSLKALAINQKKGLRDQVSSLNAVGNTYRKMANYETALAYYEKALKITTDFGDAMGIAYALYSKGMVFYEMKQYEKAKKLLMESLKISQEIKSEVRIKNTALALSNLYKDLNNYKEAYNYHVLYKINEDSLYKKENASEFELFETRLTYETRLRKQEFEQKEQDMAHEMENQRNQLTTKILIISTASLGLLALVITYAYRSKQKSNQLLANEQKITLEKNEELRMLNEEIRSTNEELSKSRQQLIKKNDDITASINYASRIQSAILPPPQQLQEVFEQSFLLYKPRDIVSGDFYWLNQNSQMVILAVADCTGHGVPGAFMSMVGSASLDKIVLEDRICHPHHILDRLHYHIRTALRQDSSQNRDGMDIAICSFIRKNQFFDKVQFAGAKNPIFVIQHQNIQVLKADRFPIGGDEYGKERSFSLHEIDMDTKTEIYLFSDGFQDQFGGKDGKKFMSKRFRELIFEIHEKPMPQQGEILAQTLQAWIAQAQESQADDILVVGLRLEAV